MAFKLNHKNDSQLFKPLPFTEIHNILIMLVLVLIKSQKTFTNLYLIYRITQ